MAGMLTELDVLRDVCARLDRAGIAYMLTGSMAMNYYAQPRMTRDIDLVVAVEPRDAGALAAAFEPPRPPAPSCWRPSPQGCRPRRRDTVCANGFTGTWRIGPTGDEAEGCSRFTPRSPASRLVADEALEIGDSLWWTAVFPELSGRDYQLREHNLPAVHLQR
jgi:hypothetical protein